MLRQGTTQGASTVRRVSSSSPPSLRGTGERAREGRRQRRRTRLGGSPLLQQLGNVALARRHGNLQRREPARVERISARKMRGCARRSDAERASEPDGSCEGGPGAERDVFSGRHGVRTGRLRAPAEPWRCRQRRATPRSEAPACGVLDGLSRGALPSVGRRQRRCGAWQVHGATVGDSSDHEVVRDRTVQPSSSTPLADSPACRADRTPKTSPFRTAT